VTYTFDLIVVSILMAVAWQIRAEYAERRRRFAVSMAPPALPALGGRFLLVALAALLASPFAPGQTSARADNKKPAAHALPNQKPAKLVLPKPHPHAHKLHMALSPWLYAAIQEQRS